MNDDGTWSHSGREMACETIDVSDVDKIYVEGESYTYVEKVTGERINRKTCSECESENTEFIQFATGDEEVVDTTVEEVGDGLLELRSCIECGTSIENILTLEKQNTRTHQ